MGRVRLSPEEKNKSTFVNSNVGSLRQAIMYNYNIKSKKQFQDGVRIDSSLQQYLFCPLGRRRSVTRGTRWCFVSPEDAGPLWKALLQHSPVAPSWPPSVPGPCPSSPLGTWWGSGTLPLLYLLTLLSFLFLLQDIFSVYCYIFLID